MDSNRKYQENDKKVASDNDKLSGASALMAAKINNAIKGYQLRKLSNEDQIADLSRSMGYMSDEGLDRSGVRDRLVALRADIEFCKGQIAVYRDNIISNLRLYDVGK